MGDFFEGLSSFLPVAPGTFGEKPPEKRDENGQQPNSVPQQKQGRGGLDCTNGGLWDNMGDQKTLAERINAGAKFNKQDRDKQTELIAGGKGAIGDMNEAEPPKEPDPPMPEAPPKSTMTKPLAPIEAGVEECDLCGRWKSKCRICAALFCEQCSMGEAIRLSHVRRGTVICGQCTVTLDKVPSARIVPLSIPELTIGPSMKSDKAWKQQVLKGASKLPSRPPPAVSFIGLRTKQKEFSPEDLDNDFKYQNLFEVLFSPELHLLAAMFEVMPEDAECNRLLAAVLRLIDRSARTEVIIKACVEMEVANTLDATTMFRRSNMSLRILRMHLSKVGAKLLEESLRSVILRLKDEVDRKRASGCSMEIDPELMTEHDDLQANVKDLVFFCGCFLDEIRQKISSGMGSNMAAIFTQLRTLSEARFPNSGLGVVAGLLINRLLAPAITEPHLFGLLDSAPDPTLERALRLVATVLKALASGEEFPRDSPMAAMNTFVSSNARGMRQLLAAASSAKSDAWDHADPKQVEVLSKDVPDLLRLIVNKMEIIERHAYLQEQQHEELRGSFLRLRAAVADLTYSASYSSGVGSRYGAAPMAPLPYETDEGPWDGQQEGGQPETAAWNSAAEAALNEGQQEEFGNTVGEVPPAAVYDAPVAMNEGMIPQSAEDEVAM